MLLFKLSRNELECGLAKLSDMCSNVKEFGDIDKIRPYQDVLIKQCIFSKEFKIARIVINQTSKAVDRITSRKIKELKD